MSGYIFGAFYDITRRIPAGKVATYGQIARLAGMPRCARMVGYAMAACRDPSVPCHRVVDRFGGTKRCFGGTKRCFGGTKRCFGGTKRCFGGTKRCFDVYAPGTQRALLEAEGVPFTPDGRVDLTACLWDGKLY